MKILKKIKIGPSVILFGSSNCPACIAQVKILNDYFLGIKKPLNIKYYDLNTKKPPQFLLNPKGNYSMPTWYFPKDGILIEGIVTPKKFVTLSGKKNAFGNLKTASEINFTNNNSEMIKNSIPQIGVLAKYGKNFPNGKGFEINNSWTNSMKDKWGNIINSGTLGREFGPGNTDKIYSTNYLNDIRMAYPGGDLSETLYSNRNCNIVNNPVAATKTAGLLYDSKNLQLSVSNFGNNNNKNFYSQMGPAFERNNKYLVNKDTVVKLHGGATQGMHKRPSKVSNELEFIGFLSKKIHL